jgi:hypothetical protein
MLGPLVKGVEFLFWVIAALEVVALNLINSPFVASVSMLTVLACSDVLAWYEFRHGSMEGAHGGRLTGGALFYAIGHAITLLFVTFDFITVVF